MSKRKIRVGLQMVDAIILSCTIRDWEVVSGIKPKYGSQGNGEIKKRGEIIFVQVPQEETQRNPILQRIGSIFAFARSPSR